MNVSLFSGRSNQSYSICWSVSLDRRRGDKFCDDESLWLISCLSFFVWSCFFAYVFNSFIFHSKQIFQSKFHSTKNPPLTVSLLFASKMWWRCKEMRMKTKMIVVTAAFSYCLHLHNLCCIRLRSIILSNHCKMAFLMSLTLKRLVIFDKLNNNLLVFRL